MTTAQPSTRVSWNQGRIVGPKPPLKPKHIWAIRTRLQHDSRIRDLAMFNTAIDSKLRGCDVVKLRVFDVHLGDSVRLRTTVVQQKTGRPVPFELTDPTRDALAAWLKKRGLRAGDWLFPSRSHVGDHVTTRQYSRLVDDWVALAGLDPAAYEAHSLRRTKVALVYKRTGDLRACQLLLGHPKLESTVRYLGIEADDALVCPSKLISDRSSELAAVQRRRDRPGWGESGPAGFGSKEVTVDAREGSPVVVSSTGPASDVYDDHRVAPMIGRVRGEETLRCFFVQIWVGYVIPAVQSPGGMA